MAYDPQKLMRRYNQLLATRKEIFLDPAFSMAKFGHEMGLNRTYTSQFVNRELGGNFRSLVHKIRMEFAEQYLKQHPDTTIIRLAKMTGFTSDTSFRRAYFQHYGRKLSISEIRDY